MDKTNNRKSILITGVSGFVGRNLVISLSGDFDIYGLDVRPKLIDGVKHIYGWDQLDQLPSVDSVIHLAGIAHDLKNKGAKSLYFSVNTGLTVKIYDWFLESNSKQFYFFSSIKAVADIPGNFPLNELAKPEPRGHYSESKRAAEEYILSHPVRSDVHQRVYILRPAMIHGPGNKGNMNLLYRFVRTGLPWPLGAFANQRSFCSIENVIYVLHHMLEQQIDSGIYHLADDEFLSTNQLVEYVAEGLSRKAMIISLPATLIQSAASMGTLLYLPFNKDRLRKLTENYMVSNEKIKTALQLEKLPVNARDGVIQTIKSFTR
jgi:nucleoside-diphosphate-sugar epimerase